MVLWNVLVATKFRKCPVQLQPEAVLRSRWGKPAAKPRTESTEPFWHGRRIPRPSQGTHQSPEAQCPHQKCSMGSTEDKYWAYADSWSIQNEKSPFTQR